MTGRWNPAALGKAAYGVINEKMMIKDFQNFGYCFGGCKNSLFFVYIIFITILNNFIDRALIVSIRAKKQCIIAYETI